MGMSDTYDQTGSAAELTEEQLEFLDSMFDLPGRVNSSSCWL